PAKLGAFLRAVSSTTPPSMPAGSTWSRSRSASCAVSAWTAESTTRNASSAKSPRGNDSETPLPPASNGCSQPPKPAPKWAVPIPTRSKSHNHCAEVLGSPLVSFSRLLRPHHLRPRHRRAAKQGHLYVSWGSAEFEDALR